MPYTVFVDDNFHYMDQSERWTAGQYATAVEALVKARDIVELCLRDLCKPGMSGDELYYRYTLFGDDPFIVGESDAASQPFSAWDYARRRATEMCRAADAVAPAPEPSAPPAASPSTATKAGLVSRAVPLVLAVTFGTCVVGMGLFVVANLADVPSLEWLGGLLTLPLTLILAVLVAVVVVGYLLGGLARMAFAATQVVDRWMGRTQ